MRPGRGDKAHSDSSRTLQHEHSACSRPARQTISHAPYSAVHPAYAVCGDMSRGNILRGNIARDNISRGNTVHGNTSHGSIACGNISRGNIAVTSRGNIPTRSRVLQCNHSVMTRRGLDNSKCKENNNPSCISPASSTDSRLTHAPRRTGKHQ